MKLSSVLLCCLAAATSLTGVPARAQQNDALSWLSRLSGAARQLSYTGTFVYQSGAQSETSRITHVYDSGNELERLEVLDGSPREVVRSNDEVKCYLPDSRLLIIEQRSRQRGFPALLPFGLAGLGDYYVVRLGARERVAGQDSQSLILEPRDDLRYGHRFWAQTDSGLLLKATMFDEHGHTIESFAFTQLQIGGPIDPHVLKSRFDASVPGSDWRVDRIQPQESRAEESAWQFRTQLPGFRRIAGMRRPARPGAPASTHVVFSDGLAAISVFIEPLSGLAGSPPDVGYSSIGAVNVYKRVVGDHLLVLMGEVPAISLKRLGDGIEPRKK